MAKLTASVKTMFVSAPVGYKDLQAVHQLLTETEFNRMSLQGAAMDVDGQEGESESGEEWGAAAGVERME